MFKRLLLALLLVASPVWAEDVLPNDDSGNSSFGDHSAAATCADLCSTINCSIALDDDPQAINGSPGDGDESIASANTQTIQILFATPSANPNTGTDAQVIEVAIYRTDAEVTTCGDPLTGGTAGTYDLAVYCAGSDRVVLATVATITGDSEVLSFNFTYPGACQADGSDLELNFTNTEAGGSPNDRRGTGLDAVRWVADVSEDASRRRMLSSVG